MIKITNIKYTYPMFAVVAYLLVLFVVSAAVLFFHFLPALIAAAVDPPLRLQR